MAGAAGVLAVELAGQGNWYDAPLWVSFLQFRLENRVHSPSSGKLSNKVADPQLRQDKPNGKIFGVALV